MKTLTQSAKSSKSSSAVPGNGAKKLDVCQELINLCPKYTIKVGLQAYKPTVVV